MSPKWKMFESRLNEYYFFGWNIQIWDIFYDYINITAFGSKPAVETISTYVLWSIFKPIQNIFTILKKNETFLVIFKTQWYVSTVYVSLEERSGAKFSHEKHFCTTKVSFYPLFYLSLRSTKWDIQYSVLSSEVWRTH